MKRLAPNWTPIHSACPPEQLIILYIAIRYRQIRRRLLSALGQTKRRWRVLPASRGIRIIG